MTANVIPFPASQPQPTRFVGAFRLDPGDPDQGCGGGHMRRLRLPSDPHGWDSIVLVADLNRHGKQAVSVCFLAPQVEVTP